MRCEDDNEVWESTALLVLDMLDFKRVVSNALSAGKKLMEAALGILRFTDSSTCCSSNTKIWGTWAVFTWSISSRIPAVNRLEGWFCSLAGSELTKAVLMRFWSSTIKTLNRTKSMFTSWLDCIKSYFSRIVKLWESSKSCDKKQFECDDPLINWVQTWIYGHSLHVHSFLWYNSQTCGKFQDTIFFMDSFEYLSSGRLRASAISQLSSL